MFRGTLDVEAVLLMPDEFCKPETKVGWLSLRGPSPCSFNLSILSNSINRIIGIVEVVESIN